MICDKIACCKEVVNHSKKTLVDRKGGKSKYSINNKSQSKYSIINFEDCVYEGKQNETKCDFGIEVNNSIYYVELKGSDVKKGIEQLLSTLNESENCFRGLTKKARLIVSKFPKPDLVKKTKEYKDLVKKTGSIENTIITQNIYTEII
jgi:hypothetical protein